MYKEFYGLKEYPFHITPDPKFLYWSQKHQDAFRHLMYGIQSRKGLTMLTGEPGTGKTALLNALIEELKEMKERTSIAYIVNSKIDINDLFKFIFDEFNINTHANIKSEYIIDLKSFLVRNFHENVSSIIILDEAQNFSSSFLEEIRLLSNIETEKEKLLQIILVGQPLLIEKINYPDLYQLKQRLGIIYNLVPLSLLETGLYIRRRLEIAEAQSLSIFHEDAIQAIYKASNGIPRIINIICDNALLFGFASRSKIIDFSTIENVAKNIGISLEKEINIETWDVEVDSEKSRNYAEIYDKGRNNLSLERDIVADKIVISREKSIYEDNIDAGGLHDLLLRKYKFIDDNENVGNFWRKIRRSFVNYKYIVLLTILILYFLFINSNNIIAMINNIVNSVK